MRKMMMVAVAAVVVSAVTVVGAKAAADNYGMAGCGLGSLVFQGSGDQVSQVLAATTNGTFDSQTFGITSGTSNCTPGGKVSATMSRGTYFAANYNEIRREAATGKGERLAALAQLSGCSPAFYAKFARSIQKNYGSVFAGAQSESQDSLKALDLATAGACKA